jgi:hypothetical protein
MAIRFKLATDLQAFQAGQDTLTKRRKAGIQRSVSLLKPAVSVQVR